MPGETRRVTATEQAYAAIRRSILRGELAPGTMLSENELAAGLAMSRTPVRTALSRLQDEGWVTIYPQRGALVRTLSDQEVRESADVRHALETSGVLHSHPETRAAAAEDLSRNIDGQAAALADGDVAAFASLALRFHRGFVELAANAVMLEIYDRLQDRQYLSIARSTARITGDPEQVLAEHRGLLDDARRGDWADFAGHLADHQARSHGLGSGQGD